MFMESNDIAVSVIIPVFNMEKYIEQCLDTIVNQTLRNIEIICVNDGSTDRSLEILNRYAAEDDRIIIINQKNSGVSAARNAGVEIAKGEFLSVLDADDYFHVTMLEYAYNKAKRLDSDLCIFRVEAYDEQARKTYPLKWCLRDWWLPQKEVFSYKDVDDRLFCLGALWAWDKLFKTSMIKEHNITFQNQRTTNDARFVVLGLAMAKRICICDTSYAVHRIGRNDSLSVTRDLSWDCFYKAFLSVEDELKRLNVYDEVEHSMQNWVLDFSLWQFETITGKRKEEVFDLIKNVIFPRYKIWDYPEEYYLWPKKYEKGMYLKNSTFHEYLKKYPSN